PPRRGGSANGDAWQDLQREKLIGSSDTQQQLHRQLIESFVGITPGTQRWEVERLALEPAGALRAEHETLGGTAPGAQLVQDLSDLRVAVEALHLGLQDQVGAHAAGGERPHTVFVFGAVGVTVEVAHAGPARVLEQLDEEESPFGIVAPEAEVLIEAADLLAVQVDVEQLA